MSLLAAAMAIGLAAAGIATGHQPTALAAIALAVLASVAERWERRPRPHLADLERKEPPR